MNKMQTKKLTIAALFIALTCVATMVINIPIPATNGYLNLGDSMVILSGMLFGRYFGGLTGGIGSALADLLLGYAHFAPVTLIVKGIEGLIAGYSKQMNTAGRVFVAVVAGFVMALGYLVAEVFMYDFTAALASFPSNLLQAAGGILIALLLYPIISQLLDSYLH